jgi:acetolactate synthase-1/2/3 large subunit
VSIEIPIDVQSAPMAMPPPEDLLPVPPATSPLDLASLDALARDLAGARRPLLWLGGGAKHAAAAVRALVERGFGVVSSANGRGILPEDDPRSLGSFTTAPMVEDFFATCDALVVVGSRLRGNETLQWKLRLPERIAQIDVDAAQRARSYATTRFVTGDARDALERLAAALPPLALDPSFHADLARTRAAADEALRRTLGPYEALVHALRDWMPADARWVRDVTVSNSTWGNRYITLRSPRAGVHALGGGIGQGVPMAIGAALAGGGKTVALSGDGGLQLCIGELATLVQEDADVLLLVMNDRGYGVIRNIQDHRFGGRHYLANILTPDLQAIAAAIGLPAVRVSDTASFERALADLGGRRGPALLEVDMVAFGPYAAAFAGPPVRAAAPA